MVPIRYTEKEELANAVSHGSGIIVALIVGYIFLQKAALNPDLFALPAVSVYLFGFISTYIISTIYHGMLPGNRKEILRKFDHATIFFQIAATYTPLCLLVLRNSGYWGWGILTAVWLVAITGIIYCFTGLKEHSNLETVCYFIMGSLFVIAIKPFTDVLTGMDAMPTCWWLIIGGGVYLMGAICYSFPKIRYMHSIFHVFCLSGGICHMIAIFFII